MTHYIFFNGPPKSGRTGFVRMFYRSLCSRTLEPCATVFSLSGPLKNMFASGLGQPWDQLDDETPRAILNGLSGHEAIVKLRNHVRGVYGPDVLARWLRHRSLNMKETPFVLVDDLLFQEDFDWFAPHKRTLIHTGKGRTGFTWLSDPDFIMGDYGDMNNSLRQVNEIVEKLDV